MTTSEIIKDIMRRWLEDAERVQVLRGGLVPRQRFECKKKQLLQYHRGRVNAFQDAVELIKQASRELAIAELLRWRDADSIAYQSGRKGGMQNPSKPKVPGRTVEYFIGRECALTEVVTLLERSIYQQGALCNSN